jgi:hypothetical protein
MSEAPKNWTERHGGTLIALLLVGALIVVMVLNAR